MTGIYDPEHAALFVASQTSPMRGALQSFWVFSSPGSWTAEQNFTPIQHAVRYVLRHIMCRALDAATKKRRQLHRTV